MHIHLEANQKNFLIDYLKMTTMEKVCVRIRKTLPVILQKRVSANAKSEIN